MESQRDYHLQLKDSERKICEALKGIQSKSEFHDVTLACDESEIKAHKVILASFSLVFQKLLKNNYHQHPLIYLRGIKYSILNNIIDFIYKGEVTVNQDTIKEFFSVAQDLKIKGLTEEDRQDAISVNISEPDFFNNYNNIDNSINPVRVKQIKQDIAQSREVIEVKCNPESLKPNSNEENMTEELQNVLETENFDGPSEVTSVEDNYALLEANTNEDSGVDELQNNKDEEQTFVMKSEEQIIKEVRLPKKEDNGLLMFPCENCNYIAHFKSNLKKHVSSQHLGIQYSCEKCDYSFKTQNTLKQHIDAKHLGMQFSCNLCAHKTTNRGNLKKHIASQHEGIRYSCDKCEQSYAQKYHLMEHIKSKHEGFRYNCKHCNNNYIEKGNLKKHIASQHRDVNTVKNDEKIISCDKCGKQFLFLAELVQHNNAVHDEIGNHLKAHIEEKHKDVNTVENNGKMISCDKCGKQFLLLAELAKHNSVVHDEIRYPCDQCEFRSASKSNLRKHIASKHEGIRYYCDHCDHKSTQRGHLKAHIELKHKEII